MDSGLHRLPRQGQFRAKWTIPDSAAGRDASLRVTATDADGNAVTQTVKNAFTVAAG
ncbi:hypothetical protein [Streptomyces sp. NRRL F-5135]|uniref:hypothetical protein n=1 Tax=Streptomyces sp. NRRL F-5135 TaxID=1463858 RepID=UPI000B158080|nr:hypothetical protein [Streptomyces sp. NRRL F-5135]